MGGGAEALAPYRKPQPAGPEGNPQPLDYLLDARDQAEGAFDIGLEVLLQAQAMREQGLPAERIALSNTLDMYWTVAQMVAYHSVGGCKLQPGDLFGSGISSGPEEGGQGSLLEITKGGKELQQLPGGKQRTFLEAGDEVVMKARCRREGFPAVGFGECRSVIIG